MGSLLSILAPTAFHVFGGGAIKAFAGGLSTAGVMTGAMVMGACDLATIGEQVGAALGAYVVGHVVTWVSPQNR